MAEQMCDQVSEAVELGFGKVVYGRGGGRGGRGCGRGRGGDEWW